MTTALPYAGPSPAPLPPALTTVPPCAATTSVPVGTAKSCPEWLCCHRLPAWLKPAESVYFFTGSTQEAAGLVAAVFTAACGAASVAAAATPAPSTAVAPTPTARTAALERSRDIREWRDVTRFDMRNLVGTETGVRSTRRTGRRRVGHPLVTRV